MRFRLTETRATAATVIFLMVLSGMPWAPAQAAPDSGPTEWGAPSRLGLGFGMVSQPALAAFPDGEFLAAWVEFDAVQAVIGMTSFVPTDLFGYGHGWGRSAVGTYLANPVLGSLSSPLVQADGAGRSMLVWVDSNGSWSQLWHVWLDWKGGGTSLSYGELGPPFQGWVENMHFDMNGAGQAALAWERRNGTAREAHAATFSPAGGWSPDTDLAPGPGVKRFPQVAVDGQGNALVAWRLTNGLTNDLYASRFVASSGWTGAFPLESGSNLTASWGVAASAGGAMAVGWSESNGTSNALRVARFAAGVGWLPSEIVSTRDAVAPQLRYDGSGTLHVLFGQDASVDVVDLVVRRFAPPVGWSAAEVVAARQDVFDWHLAVDGAGRALALWSDYSTGAYTLKSSRYVPDQGWRSPQIASPAGSGSVESAVLAMEPNGTAMALWSGRGLTPETALLASYFVPDDEAPSLTLRAPLDGLRTSEPTVLVEGTSEPGARVSANGVELGLSPLGAFSARLALSAGLNRIEVSATDLAGNTARLAVNVTFDDPVPGLAASLASANGTINATASSLAAAQAELADVSGSLALTQADLNATAADLAEARSDLNATTLALTDTRAQLSTASASLAAARAQGSENAALAAALSGRLNASEANLTATRADLAQTTASASGAKTSADEARAAASSAAGSSALALAVGLAGVAAGAAGIALGRRGKAPPATGKSEKT